MRNNSEARPEKVKKQNAKQNSPPDSTPQFACGNRGRFYGGGDDDAFWRLSFGEEDTTNGHMKSEDLLKPEVHNLDARRHGRREATLKLKQKDTELREERKLPNEETKGGEEGHECLKRRHERKAQRVLQEQLLQLEIEAEEAEFAAKDGPQFESPRIICTPRTRLISSYADAKKYGLGSIIREAGVPRNRNSEKLHNLKQGEDLDLKLKAKVLNKNRESVHVSREVQRRKPKHTSSKSKVRVYSPRMASKVEICKIKAIEDKRKAKQKMKREKEFVEGTVVGLDSFAVVKCSLDPQQDFRDSMIEMITEKHISQPEEMEELLACYLTLNSNEYHDLIIKVFRQVWLCMGQASLGIKSEKQCCCCHD